MSNGTTRNRHGGKVVRVRLLGASGLRVSEVCLGVGTFGEKASWGADRAESARIFDAYLEAGGRFFDTANTYAEGRSEEILGELVKDRRDEFVIGTKFTAITRSGDPNAWGNSRKNLRHSLHASLRRLQTDYVDILWVHAWDRLTPLEELMRALDDEVRKGTVLYIGVSNSPAWAIARANTLAELSGWGAFVGLQIEYNLATRTCEHELLPMAEHLGLSVLAWSPLAAGVLAGGYPLDGDVSGRRIAYEDVPKRRLETAAAVATIAAELGQPPAAVALSWLRHRPVPVIPILGARTVDQLNQNLAHLDTPLDAEHLQRLDDLTAPPPIMPGEFMDTPAAVAFFDAGARGMVVTKPTHEPESR
jgi:aryl-alcohol dehydrogenase-like predicted oxidoreductase